MMKKLIIILLSCAMILSCIVYFASCNKVARVELSLEENELVQELVKYISTLNANVYPPNLTVESQLDDIIQADMRILHVSFDPQNYYYVCGYYSCESEHDETNYCCASKYTWVKFESSDDITEIYKNMSIIVAFQINSTACVTDIASEGISVPTVEHYSMYSPKFVKGVNVADHLYFNANYLYSISDSEDYLADSTDKNFHGLYTLPCVEINGKNYVMFKTGMKHPYSENIEIDLKMELGKYYDSIMNAAEETRYNETKDEWDFEYILIGIEKFAQFIF